MDFSINRLYKLHPMKLKITEVANFAITSRMLDDVIELAQ
jgi:hypothetical protein